MPKRNAALISLSASGPTLSVVTVLSRAAKTVWQEGGEPASDKHPKEVSADLPLSRISTTGRGLILASAARARQI